jgi:UDP-3-O-[3-hydroxymyristoyl] glucosamine N-acyltransferase
MILQKIFLKLKSPAVADSWFMHTSAMQYSMKVCLTFFNYLVPKTRLCQRVKVGTLGKGNEIHPTAIIDYERVIIGNFCTIEKKVVIEKNTIIGNNVSIGNGAVIGSEGFELRKIAGEIIPVVHLGGVIIHDNVHIDARVCIDKSSLGEYTEIGESSVIMAGVEVGHGIKIGQKVTISEGSMIGGYAKIGDHVKIGKRCSIADGISLGEGVVIPDYSVVTREVKGHSGEIPKGS